MLRTGQIVKMPDRTLWRVDYVNACRARVVPLVPGRPIDISPGSPLEVVTDLERAKAELELAAAELELRELRQAAAALEPPAPPAQRPVVARTSGGWHAGPGTAPDYREGSMAQQVMDYILLNPGQSTAQIVAGCGVQGAVAACVSRFNQAGLIHKA